MTKQMATNIASIVMAISAITCIYAVYQGMDVLPAIGMLLCTSVIYLVNRSAKKTRN